MPDLRPTTGDAPTAPLWRCPGPGGSLLLPDQLPRATGVRATALRRLHGPPSDKARPASSGQPGARSSGPGRRAAARRPAPDQVTSYHLPPPWCPTVFKGVQKCSRVTSGLPVVNLPAAGSRQPARDLPENISRLEMCSTFFANPNNFHGTSTKGTRIGMSPSNVTLKTHLFHG